MSRPMNLLARFGRDRGGATAVEFGLVLPVFLMLVFGAINVSRLMDTTNSMHFAVEEAARCYAVNDVLCPTPSAAVDYAKTKYHGTGTSAPEFEASDEGCGHTVKATTTFELSFAIASLDVPLSASACYPGVEPV